MLADWARGDVVDAATQRLFFRLVELQPPPFGNLLPLSSTLRTFFLQGWSCEWEGSERTSFETCLQGGKAWNLYCVLLLMLEARIQLLIRSRLYVALWSVLQRSSNDHTYFEHIFFFASFSRGKNEAEVWFQCCNRPAAASQGQAVAKISFFSDKSLQGYLYAAIWAIMVSFGPTLFDINMGHWDLTMQRILPFWTFNSTSHTSVQVSWLKLGEGHTFYLLVERETKSWREHDPASWLWRWPKSRLKVSEKCQSLISHCTDL